MTIAFAVVVVMAAIFYPLFLRERDIPEAIPLSPIQHLEDRKQAIYENLRDLQFEYRLGKLSDEDYKQTKQALQKELAVVLAETEETVKRLGFATSRVAAGKRPKEAPPKNAPAKTTTKTVCPNCGAAFSESLKFCGECGKAIA